MLMQQPKRRKPSELWTPVPFSADIAYAIQAMSNGEANDAQQKNLLDWLLTDATQTYEEPFVPDNARVTDYLLGRRSVGLAITKHLNISPAKIEQMKAG